MSVRIDAARRRVEVVASGVLTGDEMRAAQKEIAQSPGFEPDFDALFDLTAVSGTLISADDVKGVAHRTVFGPQSRRAFVTTNPTAYGLMRMLGVYVEDRSGEAQTFADPVSAELWLARR